MRSVDIEEVDLTCHVVVSSVTGAANVTDTLGQSTTAKVLVEGDIVALTLLR
jgi:hypothetical protein